MEERFNERKKERQKKVSLKPGPNPNLAHAPHSLLFSLLPRHAAVHLSLNTLLIPDFPPPPAPRIQIVSLCPQGSLPHTRGVGHPHLASFWLAFLGEPLLWQYPLAARISLKSPFFKYRPLRVDHLPPTLFYCLCGSLMLMLIHGGSHFLIWDASYVYFNCRLTTPIAFGCERACSSHPGRQCRTQISTSPVKETQQGVVRALVWFGAVNHIKGRTHLSLPSHLSAWGFPSFMLCFSVFLSSQS